MMHNSSSGSSSSSSSSSKLGCVVEYQVLNVEDRIVLYVMLQHSKCSCQVHKQLQVYVCLSVSLSVSLTEVSTLNKHNQRYTAQLPSLSFLTLSGSEKMSTIVLKKQESKCQQICAQTR
jgi:hypothetical protein